MNMLKKYTSFIINIIYGCIIGVANIIPGVSGGTMAVMLNIYDKLIDSFTGIRKHFKESIKFLAPILVGAVIGVFAFSKLIKFLINVSPMPLCFFFIGLILGSLPLLFRKSLETAFRPVSLIPLFIFLGVMTVLAFINTEGRDSASIQITLDVFNWFYFLFGSAFAAMCMMVPGVSGSMILMILGLYATVLGAISDVFNNFLNSSMILLPVGIGVILGIVFGARLIDICIKKQPQLTFFAIIGLMLGSPIVIFLKFSSQSPDNFTFNLLNITISIIVFAVGLFIAIAFGSEKLKTKFEKNTEVLKNEGSVKK